MIEWVKNRGPKDFNFHLPVEIKNEKTPITWTDPRVFNS
jgi:hypothetical protein